MTTLLASATMPANIPEVHRTMTEKTDDNKQIHIKLGAKLHQALKLESAYSETTIQDLVVELIRQRILTSEFSTLIEDVD